MFRPSDTIVATATPEGRSGIGVVRLSGPDALRIAHVLTTRGRPLEPRRATFTRLRQAASTPPLVGTGDESGHVSGIVDQIVATYFPSPTSYTGEDVVELSGHGNPVLLRQIVEAATAAGARLAEPGEFTLRAFVNERLDLVQAEAVADLIEAVTPSQARVAFDQLEGTLTRAIGRIEQTLFDEIARLEASLDFPDEGYHFVDGARLMEALTSVDADVTGLLASAPHGRLLREGRIVAIVGKPNAGKSSVFNALVGTDRAIVTAHAGTTRDMLTERIDVEGVPVTLVDTAGIRDAEHEVEQLGVERARQAASRADLILLVLDRAEALDGNDLDVLSDTAGRTRVLVVNKLDRAPAWTPAESLDGSTYVEVSALTGAGVPALRSAVHRALLQSDELRDTPAVSNMRHIQLLKDTHEALVRAMDAAQAKRPEEFVLADLQEALRLLGEVTGQRTPDDVLASIFSRFCIGK
ncbi:MAG: tRNA uridine-5-carboxymethylaminomethyl(34) synthesis GTPase MnmE [Vicinamibacterales bacterium]